MAARKINGDFVGRDLTLWLSIFPSMLVGNCNMRILKKPQRSQNKVREMKEVAQDIARTNHLTLHGNRRSICC